MAGDPEINGQDYRLVIHAIQLSGQHTLLLYSLSGAGIRGLLNAADLQVVDDRGQVSQLIAAMPVLEEPGLPEVGGLRFERRDIGVTGLFLHITPKQGDGERLETRLTWFERPPEDLDYYLDPNDYLDRTFFAANETAAEQDGYRISFQSWGLMSATPEPNPPAELEAAPDTPGPDPHSTPPPVRRTPWADVDPGVEVIGEITLSIENAADGEVSYLWLQLLSNGDELGMFNGEIIQPTPILVAPTPTPPGPYP